MANKLYEESSVQAIATAIRGKNGSSDTYTISQMAPAIDALETGGGFYPSLLVSAATGSTVTATNGTDTVTLTEIESGKYWGEVTDYGEWTLSDGSNTTKIDVSAVEQYAPKFVSKTLDKNEWGTISEISGAGLASNYWSVGDAKAVTINGTVGICTFSNETYYAFIIGFDHNSGREGGNRVHFQIGKTAVSGGTDICLVDSSYNSTGSSAAFRMNTTNTNVGGWNSSYMRKTICGTSLSSYSGTFIAVLPAALRSALKTVTKYTDNTGNQSTEASAVTATTDVIFLLSEKEVFGTIERANTNEGTYQEQYAYYAAGNSKVKYQHSATGTAAFWWLRSPASGNATNFVLVSTSGSVSNYSAYDSDGFAPGFVV